MKNFQCNQFHQVTYRIRLLYPKLKENHITQIISFEILESGRPFISIINIKEFKNGETSELPDVFPALSKFQRSNGTIYTKSMLKHNSLIYVIQQKMVMLDRFSYAFWSLLTAINLNCKCENGAIKFEFLCNNVQYISRKF